MSIWNSRYLFAFSILGVVLGIDMGFHHVFFSKQSLPSAPACLSPIDHQFSLQAIQLPSMLPNFHVAAKRHVFLPTDLRRADLVVGDHETDSFPSTNPVVDKVLVVPKKFRRRL